MNPPFESAPKTRSISPRRSASASPPHKVLVTGGAGFIGSHVVDALLAEGHEVLVVDDLSTGRAVNVDAQARLVRMDIRDAHLSSLVAREGPRAVYHLAAQADVRRAVSDPHHDASINLLGGLNVLRACADHGVQKLIYISTAAVYGEPEQLPVDEEHPIGPLTGYGISKHTFERYLPLQARECGLDYTVLRFANVYGPRQDPRGEAGVVAIFAGRMLDGNPCTIYGDGTQSRDFVYVEDCAALCVRLLASAGSGRTYNVGTGRATSVNELHRQLAAVTGALPPAVYAPARQGEIKHFVFDTARIERELGWQAETDLAVGLQQTVVYFQTELSA